MSSGWFKNIARVLLGVVAVVAFFCATMPVSRYGVVAYDVSRFGFAAILFGRLIWVVHHGWRRSKHLLREQSVAKRVASVPRRFGLGTLFVVTLAFALASATMHWLKLDALPAVMVLMFVAFIGALQAILDQVPRQASMVAGALFFPPVFMTMVIFDNPGYVSGTTLADLAFHAACWSVGGGVIGYGTGTLVAGVFLVMKWCSGLCTKATQTFGNLGMPHDFDGKKYEQASAAQKEWGRKLIEELELEGAERVLDLGCGDGTLTAGIADLLSAGEAVGIDASQGMINTARCKQRENLQFILMNIDDLDFVDEFDVVFSSATLHWVKDHQRLIRNVRRALRTDGRLRFNFAGDGNCSHFLKVIREAMELDAFAPCFSDFQWPWYMPGIEEYASFVEGTGLRNARVWGETADRFFPDVEAMIRWIDQPCLVPFLACVSGEHRPPFRDFVVKRMIEETKQGDGRCFETFRRINVAARR
jgi:trans-aconitate 2-methyltransferase